MDSTLPGTMTSDQSGPRNNQRKGTLRHQMQLGIKTRYPFLCGRSLLPLSEKQSAYPRQLDSDIFVMYILN